MRPETDRNLHSKYGPSSADQWIACPGSVAEMDRIPPEAVRQSSVYADEGSAAHAFAEWCVSRDMSPGKYRGQYIDRRGVFSLAGGEGFFPIDEEMVEGVELYRQTIRQLLQECGTSVPPDMYLEQRVYYMPGRLDVFGTADCLIVEPAGKLICVDFKYGRGVVVGAEGNDQLRLYAAGALNWLGDDGLVSSVEVIIVQPRAFHEEGPVRRCEMSVEEIRAVEATAHAAIQAAESPNPPLISGPHCRWCKARPVCRKLQAEAYDLAAEEWADLPTESVVLRDLVTMTPEELATALARWERIKAWGASLHDLALNLAKGGGTLPGWKLVRGRKNRVWTNVRDLEEGLREAGIPDDESHSEPKIKTPAQMERLMGKEWVAKFCHTPEGEPTLVPESDARPAVSAGFDSDIRDFLND